MPTAKQKEDDENSNDKEDAKGSKHPFTAPNLGDLKERVAIPWVTLVHVY